jgi:hypothetical protein
MAELNTAERRAVLGAFDRTLGREVHDLARWPELTWQQLYNRLQWEGEPPVPAVLEPAFEERRRADAGPWFRTRTPPFESEALIRTFAGHRTFVKYCDFSPDGSRLLSADDDGLLVLWDVETGVALATAHSRTGSLKWCRFNPDGRRVLLMGENCTLVLLDAEIRNELASLDGSRANPTFSPDGRWLVSAFWEDHTLRLWDVETGDELATLRGHEDGINACCFSHDSRRLLSASDDHTLRLWDAETGACEATLLGHTDKVIACAFSPDGRFIRSASGDRSYYGDTQDQTVRLWDAQAGSELVVLPAPGFQCLALGASAPFFAYGDRAGCVHLLEIVGVEHGPVIVTAVDLGGGPVVRCPACLEKSLLDESWLGQVLPCPRPGCESRMRVNPFVTRLEM